MKPLEVFASGSPPALALESAVETLASVGLDPKALWLGGGAVLAARWGHRQDGSVNLFARKRDLPGPLRMGMSLHVGEALPESARESLEGGLHWARWETGHGKVGIFARHPWLEPWLSDEGEARHRIPLESTASIIGAKALARPHYTGEILDRDLHDLAVCAMREPEALNPSWFLSGGTAAPAIAEDILFLDRIAPREPEEAGEALGWLRRVSSVLYAKGRESFVREVRRSGRRWLGKVPSVPRRYPVPDWEFESQGLRPVPLDAFQHDPFLERHPFRPVMFMGSMGKNMAGAALAPKAEEIRDWIRAEDPGSVPPEALGYIGEHLSKLTGAQAIMFRQGCGASLMEIARLARATGVQGSLFMGWLDRYAWRRAGDMREEVEGYAVLGSYRGFG